MLTVSVAVTAALPTIAGGAATEHVGVSVAPGVPPVTAHLRATLPAKPPLGVIVMADVALAPGDPMMIAVLLSAKPAGAGDTTKAKPVVALRLSVEVAVTFTL